MQHMITGTEHPRREMLSLPATSESTFAIYQQPQGYLLAISLSAVIQPCCQNEEVQALYGTFAF